MALFYYGKADQSLHCSYVCLLKGPCMHFTVHLRNKHSSQLKQFNNQQHFPPFDFLLLLLPCRSNRILSDGCSAARFCCSFFVAKTNFVIATNICKKE